METQEIMKKCSKCGEVLPIYKFYKCAKTKDGYQSHCKKCHNNYYAPKVNKPIIKDAPNVEQSAAKECDNMGLDKIPSRLLIHELRRRGYRGELELVTIQKVVI